MATLLPPPSSQKAGDRPISFMLIDPTAPDVISRSRTITLAIRPLELQRSDPSRLTVTQTLANAWMDNFGPGIGRISISGHTGWHRSQEGTATPDGLERFKALRKQVYEEWHKRKQDAIKAGRDPDQIQLIFADKLDDFACVVAIDTFVLRRSKSQPLLVQYQILMTVLNDIIDPVNATTPKLLFNSPSDLQAAALKSLNASTKNLQTYLQDIQNFIDSKLAAPVKQFMMTTSKLYSTVSDNINQGSAIADELIHVAHLTAQVGLNVVRTAQAVAGIPSFTKARLMQVANEYSNIFCVLRNALQAQAFYPDYSPLYGSSNCSSTNGGTPPSQFADTNPFFQVVPANPPLPVTINPNSLQSMQLVANNDLVQAPMNTDQLASHMNAINDGMTVV